MVRGDRGLVAGLVFLPVIGFVIAAAYVLWSAESGDDGVTTGPLQTSWDFFEAVRKKDAVAAAELTDDPDAAEETLERIFAELPKKTKLNTTVGELERTDGTASGAVSVRWKFGTNRDFSYRVKLKLVKDDRWLVSWSPSVVHPELQDEQYFKLVKRTDMAAVVDRSKKPILTWDDGSATETKPGRARLLRTEMLARADKAGAPPDWAVAAIDDEDKRAGYLEGRGPGQSKPEQTTLSIDVQDAAQAVVDRQRTASALVALQPSTGEILALAQNEQAHDKGPIALSGLYPPGKMMDVVATAAGERATGAKLVKNASTLGLNADFNVPGVLTEAGAVRAEESKLSPFGAALMSATISAGKAVKPTLWADRPTKTIKSYKPPDEATLTRLRDSLREGESDVYGKSAFANASGGVKHGWYTGYRKDLAFALLVEDGGSARVAADAGHEFLGKVPT